MVEDREEVIEQLEGGGGGKRTGDGSAGVCESECVQPDRVSEQAGGECVQPAGVSVQDDSVCAGTSGWMPVVSQSKTKCKNAALGDGGAKAVQREEGAVTAAEGDSSDSESYLSDSSEFCLSHRFKYIQVRKNSYSLVKW